MERQHNTHLMRQAFEATALRHMKTVSNYAMTLTRHRDDADDLTQETFYKAYRAFHQFQAGTNIKAWLLTIARNSYLNRYRQALHRPVQVDIDSITPAYAAPQAALHWEDRESIEGWLQHEVHDEVKTALDQLPPIYRETVFLADVASYSYQEIADVMECPVGTVMSRLYRGRHLLRTYLMDFVQGRGYFQATTPSDAVSCDVA